MLFLGNLVDAIITCVNHPMAANQTFLVSDGEDVSTTDLVRRIASSLGNTARVFFVPTSLMRFAGKIMRKSAEVDRLLGTLIIDSSKIRKQLGWIPPFTMEEGLKKTAEWYKTSGRDSLRC
jgi:UDP-glucose 4-epimerase